MDLSKSSSRQREIKEYRQQVRKRGAQFIQALQQKLPGVKVLTLFQQAISQNSWMSLILRNGCVSFLHSRVWPLHSLMASWMPQIR